jgi:hypothetical protein
MFVLSNQPQDFVKVPCDAYRLTIASFPKACLPSLIGNILLLSPLCLMYFFLENGESEFPSWLWIYMCVMALLYPAVMIGTLIAVKAVADGQEVSLVDNFKQGIQYIVPCTVASFLFLFFVSIGSVLLLIPGFFLYVSLSFWWGGIVTEKQSALNAFRFSRKLVSKNWWRTAMILSQMFGLVIATSTMIDFAMNLFPTALADVWFVTLIGLALSILYIVIMPIFFCALMVVQLNDLKQRNQESILVKACEPEFLGLA